MYTCTFSLKIIFCCHLIMKGLCSFAEVYLHCCCMILSVYFPIITNNNQMKFARSHTTMLQSNWKRFSQLYQPRAQLSFKKFHKGLHDNIICYNCAIMHNCCIPLQHIIGSVQVLIACVFFFFFASIRIQLLQQFLNSEITVVPVFGTLTC